MQFDRLGTGTQVTRFPCRIPKEMNEHVSPPMLHRSLPNWVPSDRARIVLFGYPQIVAEGIGNPEVAFSPRALCEGCNETFIAFECAVELVEVFDEQA